MGLPAGLGGTRVQTEPVNRRPQRALAGVTVVLLLLVATRHFNILSPLYRLGPLPKDVLSGWKTKARFFARYTDVNENLLRGHEWKCFGRKAVFIQIYLLSHTKLFHFPASQLAAILDSAAPAFGVKVFPMVHWAAGLSCA